MLGMTVASGLHAQRPAKDKEKARQVAVHGERSLGFCTGLVLLLPAQEIFRCGNVLEVGRIPIRLPGALQGAQIQRETHHATRVTAEETQRQKIKKVEEERQKMEELYQEELLREADRNVDLMFPSYKDEFNRMQDCITDGLLYCMQKSKGKLQYQVDELSRQNEILCADIAYIHKMGVGYGLENAKRQKAYEEARQKMEELVKRTANLCAVASTHH